MYCKFCGTEVGETVNQCPACGKTLAEPVAEKKKINAWKKALAIAGVVVLAIVLVGAILHFMGLGKQVLHTLKFWRANDINYKLSYTVKNETAENKKDIVVATVGSQQLTNGELQAHYWLAVYDFLDYYGYYLDSMGVDLSKPLSDQICDQKTGQTYQQMFLESALNSWYRYATLVELSKEAGFQLTEEQQEYIDSIGTQVKDLAKDYKYTDVEEFVDKEFFPGCSFDIYMDYTKSNYLALSYYDTLYKDMKPTKDQIDAYYAEHEAEFKEKGMDKAAGDYYDVRHILVEIKEDTTDNNPGADFSDMEWAVCLQSAQDLLDQFLAGEKTEEAFAKLAIEHSKDPGSASNGGLYSDLTKETGLIDGFKNWYLDESRKPGDTGLVKNTESATQGYHIMYFSGSSPIWEVETESAIMTDRTNKLLEEGKAKWPMEVNYKAIVLGQVDLSIYA